MNYPTQLCVSVAVALILGYIAYRVATKKEQP